MFFPLDLLDPQDPQDPQEPPPTSPPPTAPLEEHARRALSACPPEPPWLEARWRALLSALLSATPPHPSARPPSPTALIALCALITPRPHRPAALSALLSALTRALPQDPLNPTHEASARAAAHHTRAALLSALKTDEWSEEARAALTRALTLP